ncbi:hypothetical protein [Streptomyces sp. YS-3]|uniref:hypothetical protein n=1 Tax=Streptomyces sp. YS-3 TaxID=3381352 RepID=UPI0038629E57
MDKAVIQGGQALLPQTQEDPVTVHASQLQGRQGYVGPVPPAREEWHDPINRVDLFTSVIHLIIEAAGDQTAIVNRLDVRLESCDAPPRISYTVPYTLRSAAPLDPREHRQFLVRLTAEPAGNTTVPTSSARPAHDVPDFPYTVTPDSPDHFYLHVTADEPGDYRWRIDVHWICKGQSGTTVADQAGHPFRLVHPERRENPDS